MPITVICPKRDESRHGVWCYNERLECTTEVHNDSHYKRSFRQLEAAKLFVRHFRDCEITGN